jgi:hypothetical protein
MEQRFEYSPAEVARVRTVQFGVLSPDEIVSAPSLLLPHSDKFWISCLSTRSNQLRWRS